MKTAKKAPKVEANHEQLSPQEKFKLARSSLCTSLIEREEEIDIVLTALIAQENPLLVGPPGVGKSLLLDSLAMWVETKPFDYLLTKFTTPEELFGPINIEKLKRSEYERLVDGYLPTVCFSFLDEIWKGSSAILNTLLKVLNEHRFKFGQQELDCPLLICVAASNEWPNDDNGGKELNALFDRFLFRKTVATLSDTGMKKLFSGAVNNTSRKPSFAVCITPEEIKQAHHEAKVLPWTDNAKVAMWDIYKALKKEAIHPSPRRYDKGFTATRAYAFLQGSKEVLPEHLEILQYVLWEDPIEQPKVCGRLISKIANPLGFRVMNYYQQAQDVVNQAENTLRDKPSMSKGEREGVCQEVLVKLKEIHEDLKVLSPDERRDKVLAYVNEEIKTWSYMIIGAKRE